ncbi:hypothetical protein [Nostoc sphaeroides]|nr:hypothetical protein [Nostoc sphaeroides]
MISITTPGAIAAKILPTLGINGSKSGRRSLSKQSPISNFGW